MIRVAGGARCPEKMLSYSTNPQGGRGFFIIYLTDERIKKTLSRGSVKYEKAA